MRRLRRAERAARAIGAIAAFALLPSCDTLSARRRAHEGAGLHKDGELAAAAGKYEEAQQLDPSLATVHLNLGFTYLALLTASPKGKEAEQNGARAVAELKRYIALRPDDPRGRQYLLQAFLDGRRYDDALAYFEPELRRDPPSDEAIGLLAQIAVKAGRIEDALGWHQKRIDRAPGSVESLEELGVVIWDHLRNHAEVRGEARLQLADRGIAALQRATTIKPQAAEAFSYWNLLLRERATAHLCDLPDAGAASVALDAGVVASCVQLKAADLLEADRLMRVASEMFKARAAGAATQQPGPK